MAILSKIRDRSMFLILIVGLALFAFVLDPTSIQSFFSTSKINSIGAVNGEDIDREEFMRQVEAYRSQTGGRGSQMQAVNAVWNTMVSEKIFETQLEEAGIVVGEKDIWESVIQLPAIQNSPMFKNEANLFDEEKLKEYIANIRDDADGGDPSAWFNWLATETNIKQNLERQAYTSLVSAGLGASLQEGERDYLDQNTKIDAQFVYVPYTSIADSLALASRAEIKDYLETVSKKYDQEATRSLEYVKFDIVPSQEDEDNMKAKVEGLINDREEYSNAAKATVAISGLKNATDYEDFFTTNNSDLNIDTGYKFNNQVFAEVSEAVFAAELNDVVGPYKQNGIYKISKVVEKLQLPDSVKSSHILVPYAGATRSTSLKTKEEAKKTADSIYNLVRRNKVKYTEIADEINTDATKGKGGDLGWMTKNQAFSASFDRDFADYIYENNTGSIDVVETAFGYHVIRIDEQTKKEDAVSLVTFGLRVDASEETENIIFENAETLAAKLAGGENLYEVATANDYMIESALNLKILEENIPGLAAQRQIVTWAFENARELGDFKRFDVEVAGVRSYAVAVLKGKTDGDEMVVTADIIAQLGPEITNKKKASMIKDKLSGATLEEIAQSANVAVRNASLVTLASPLISGVGNEPGVVGAMSTLKIDEVSEVIEGEKGVFVMKITKRELPVTLENYDTFRRTKELTLKTRSFLMYQVLEETADIKDNRGKFF